MFNKTVLKLDYFFIYNLLVSIYPEKIDAWFHLLKVYNCNTGITFYTLNQISVDRKQFNTFNFSG